MPIAERSSQLSKQFLKYFIHIIKNIFNARVFRQDIDIERDRVKIQKITSLRRKNLFTSLSVVGLRRLV